MNGRPPRAAVWLVSLFVPPDCRDAVVGDLEEAFYDDVLPARGSRRARLWFWRETLSVVCAYATTRRPRIPSTSPSRSTHIMRQDIRDALRSLTRVL